MLRHLAYENDQLQEHYNKLWDEYEESKKIWENEMKECQRKSNDFSSVVEQLFKQTRTNETRFKKVIISIKITNAAL